MDDVQAATAALQAENGVSFFGRDLVIQYAKETSDRIAKRDGTYVPKAKRKKVESTIPNSTPDASALPSSMTTTTASAPPSHILLTQNLPETVTLEMLKIMFHPYAGYKDVRLPRPGLAFIEFESEPHATLALQALNGFQLTSIR
jgi:U2 small nuclear ribonucleoprotein B''